MVSKECKFAFRIIGIILAINSIFFQVPKLIFGTMVKSEEDIVCEGWYYIAELIPHIFTIVILFWFIIYQIKRMINRK